MWPFKPKSIVDADAEAWLTENFCWLLQQFGGTASLTDAKLVQPRPGFFSSNGETGHALALSLFEQVKGYCGMGDWDVDLIADNNPLAEPTPLSLNMIAPKKHALGTFSASGNRIEITYVPPLLQRPDRFIATMAHELAHYLLATASEWPPCARDETEFLTDLAAIYMGFGVFLANGRFDFTTAQDGPMHGWQWQRSGYLPENDVVFALALFIHAKGIAVDPAATGLKPHLAGQLRKALRYLANDTVVTAQIRQALAEADARLPVPADGQSHGG